MSEPTNQQPYKTLGLRLKSSREKLHLSLAEVCGAVEIEPDLLSRIERGEKCPAEDVLLLLLAHLNIQEEEANKLWDLAGYDRDKSESKEAKDARAIIDELKPLVMLVQPDNRIMYSDIVNTTVNSRGVVINFLQDQGQAGAGVPVARVGMSKEQARSVIAVLQQTLATDELNQANRQAQRSLPAPRSDQKPKDNLWLNRNDQLSEH